MKPVYITSTGSFLPNAPVDNDAMEQFLGLVGGKPSRLKDRILKQNGIVSRHYALDRDGRSTHMNEELAAHAIIEALERRGIRIEEVEMLACGTTQGDVPLPGFASMVHGRLGGRPMEVVSTSGVCCSGMAALLSAFRAVQSGQRRIAVACGSELVSRSLKASRFEAGATLEDHRELGLRSFDADFLRFMLSDGAGAMLLERRVNDQGLSLRIEWIELVSHAHERPVCMYTGLVDKDDPRAGNSWLDYPDIAQAERTGMMRIRQDTRLLPEIIKLGVEEYLRLLQRERLRAEEIDHLLCHYSSHFFKGEILALLERTGAMIPEGKWFTNLYTRGNTGAASIFIMLDEGLRSGRFHDGETILLMVPESGRFSVSFAKLVVVSPDSSQDRPSPAGPRCRVSVSSQATPPKLTDEVGRRLGIELGLVWADFERALGRVPIVQRVESGTATREDYKRLLVNLRQQVMEGARWIARAASNISIDRFPIRSALIKHAAEEHRDYQMLERDFIEMGGTREEITAQPKNIGSEALSAFMFHRASQPDPLDLIGAMFVIEGLGQRKAAHWAELLRRDLRLTAEQTSFLTYHGKNDDTHLDRLNAIIESGVLDARSTERVVKTAKVVARLYALQLEEIDHV